MDKLLDQRLKTPAIAIALLAGVVSLLRALAEEARKSGSTDKDAASAAPQAADGSDLETVVRRNFEEMMRRRAAAASVPPAPKRAPVDYDERAQREPKTTEPTRSVRTVRTEGAKKPRVASRHLEAAAKAVAGTLKTSADHRAHRQARNSDLRRTALAPKNLRQAILLREILDRPPALRDD